MPSFKCGMRKCPILTTKYFNEQNQNSARYCTVSFVDKCDSPFSTAVLRKNLYFIFFDQAKPKPASLHVALILVNFSIYQAHILYYQERGSKTVPTRLRGCLG